MKFKITPEELNNRLKLDFESKIKHAIFVFLQFYFKYDGHVYTSFSGGKDSQLLVWIIDEIFAGRWEDYIKQCLIEILNIDTKEKWNFAYKELILDKKFGVPPKVFCDTGLEFPELRKHVKTFDNVTWMKPKMKFPDVIKNIGVAVGSKKIALQLQRLKGYISNPTTRNKASMDLYLTGIKRDGTKSKSFGLSKFWLKLLDADFNVSDKCCDIFKKEPFKRYQKETGRKPITGTNVTESMQRRASYLQTGCNSFDKGKEMSRPLSIFTDEDVWAISDKYMIIFCEVYYDREFDIPDGKGGLIKVVVPGEKRTGCMFCLFGIHLEDKSKLNRFQRLGITHPKQYNFMLTQCKLNRVLDFIGIDYKITPEMFLKEKSKKTLF